MEEISDYYKAHMRVGEALVAYGEAKTKGKYKKSLKRLVRAMRHAAKCGALMDGAEHAEVWAGFYRQEVGNSIL